jgi:hypothetical protein
MIIYWSKLGTHVHTNTSGTNVKKICFLYSAQPLTIDNIDSA